MGDKKDASDVTLDDALEGIFLSAIENTTEDSFEGTSKGVI